MQLDDVYIAGLSSPEVQIDGGEYSKEQLIDLAVRVANKVFEDKPEDLIVTTHLCRGNYQSAWAFGGSYEKICTFSFCKRKGRWVFLEYDDERSRDFKPLENIPQVISKWCLACLHPNMVS